MHHRFRRILIALLPACALAGAAGRAPAFEQGSCLAVVRVEPWDFLYIRSRPDHRSAKAGAIAPESILPIVITGQCTPPGAPPRRLWCPVTYYVTRDATRSGYVKAFFTEVVPCPPSLEFLRKQ